MPSGRRHRPGNAASIAAGCDSVRRLCCTPLSPVWLAGGARRRTEGRRRAFVCFAAPPLDTPPPSAVTSTEAVSFDAGFMMFYIDRCCYRVVHDSIVRRTILSNLAGRMKYAACPSGSKASRAGDGSADVCAVHQRVQYPAAARRRQPPFPPLPPLNRQRRSPGHVYHRRISRPPVGRARPARFAMQRQNAPLPAPL